MRFFILLLLYINLRSKKAFLGFISKFEMENKKFILSPTTLTIFILGLIYILSISPANTATAVTDTSSSSLSNYIVQVRKLTDQHSSTSEDLDTFYRSFLPATAASSNQEQRIVHSYRHVLSGFAAKLTAEEARAIQEKDGVLGVRPEKVLSLHTTHTPDFLGLHQGVGLWKSSNFGKGVIIGVLDTGVLPDHPSFSDKGMPPPPAKWKGRCDFNKTSCNNKLIGARSFVRSSSGTVLSGDPPYDGVGHGTHTSSTAAGAFVTDASALGNANGTAVGMAPLAHLAVYKVCGANGCLDGDILGAFDAAIEDGVDVLSLSLGGSSKLSFDYDAIAVGAYAATQKGIFVSCSAGNSGPRLATISNEAPWILTVGAGSIDRTIKATARLGNGQEFDGETLYQPHDFHQVLLPLIYPGLHNISAARCHPGSLRGRTDLRGKVVVCDLGDVSNRVARGQEVKDAGGAAMILVNEAFAGYTTFAEAHVLPAVHVSFAAGIDIKKYVSTASAPMATIQFKGTHISRSVAPAVSFFSSRGPSSKSPGILKPDIIGPGLNILAGWPLSLDNSTDKRHSFNVISGTSMSCPHLSGVAALLKSLHPDWSPAAIKSAIITTATNSNMEGHPIVDETLHPADIFATGAGHVNPSKAADPGLIYDIAPQDYIPYLCGLNYTDSQIEIVTKEKVKCSSIKSIPDYQLNYPSITVMFHGSITKVNLTRTVRNVGPAKSRYKLVIDPVKGLESFGVDPTFLEFTKPNQTATFKVVFTRKEGKNTTELLTFGQGAITWLSAQHSVRTPVALTFL